MGNLIYLNNNKNKEHKTNLDFLKEIEDQCDSFLIEDKDLANPFELKLVKNLIDSYNKEIDDLLGESIASNTKSRTFWIKNFFRDTEEFNLLLINLQNKFNLAGMSLLATNCVQNKEGVFIEYDYKTEEFSVYKAK